jgi:hypothetical protein
MKVDDEFEVTPETIRKMRISNRSSMTNYERRGNAYEKCCPPFKKEEELHRLRVMGKMIDLLKLRMLGLSTDEDNQLLSDLREYARSFTSSD